MGFGSNVDCVCKVKRTLNDYICEAACDADLEDFILPCTSIIAYTKVGANSNSGYSGTTPVKV